jgi:hypothetical protein
MSKYYIAIFCIGMIGSGCQEKEEAPVDWDRIVHLAEEESAEWAAPSEGSMLSGYTSPEELQSSENQADEFAR